MDVLEYDRAAILHGVSPVSPYFPFILNVIRDVFEIKHPSVQSSSLSMLLKIKSLHVGIDHAGAGRELEKISCFRSRNQ